jgi:hypothetical protein
MIKGLFLKISYFVLIFNFIYFEYAMAASGNSQQARTNRPAQSGGVNRAVVENRQPAASSQAKAQVPPNHQVAVPAANTAKAPAVNSSSSSTPAVSASVEEAGKDASMQNDSAKKKTKKKDNVAEEEKSDEPIEFNDQKGILAGLDYPELQVVPRASERIAFEAQEEKTRLISPYWPVQMSAVSLFIAGFMSKGKYKDDSTDTSKNASRQAENAFSSQLAMLTGGLWLGTTYYMTHYLSYGEALQEIRKINGKDKKNTLLRERLAEEAIERPARITYLINTLSVWSTLFSSLYLANNTTQVSPSYAGIAAAMAFMPWLIDNRITRNWEKHQEYKRKIYAPLTMGTWQYDLPTKEWRPLLTLNWVF